MASSGIGRRRSFKQQQVSVEEEALNQIAKEADDKLAASRQARTEARIIRARELQRQRIEEEEREKQQQGDHTKDVLKQDSGIVSNSLSSPVSSCSSLTGDDTSETLKALKKEHKELEEKYKKLMIQNSQIDNEKMMYRYEVELRKEETEDALEQLKTTTIKNKQQASELTRLRHELSERERENGGLLEEMKVMENLMRENGLELMSVESSPNTASHDTTGAAEKNIPIALLSADVLQILNSYTGSLDERLKQIFEERQDLMKKVSVLQLELNNIHDNENRNSPKLQRHNSNTNGLSSDYDVPVEVQKQLNEYRFGIKKAEQEITTLEGNCTRFESQVKRYKSAAENAEKLEEELKSDKRKLQRELREAQLELEELRGQNSSLKTRMEKMKKEKQPGVINTK